MNYEIKLKIKDLSDTYIIIKYELNDILDTIHGKDQEHIIIGPCTITRQYSEYWIVEIILNISKLYLNIIIDMEHHEFDKLWGDITMLANFNLKHINN